MKTRKEIHRYPFLWSMEATRLKPFAHRRSDAIRFHSLSIRAKQKWLDLWKKLPWLIFYVVCLAVCCHQVKKQVTHYLSFPVDIDIVMYRNDTLHMPSFTLCSARLHREMKSRLLMLLRIVCSKAKRDNCTHKSTLKQLDFHKVGFSVESLWEDYAIKDWAIDRVVPCVASPNTLCEDSLSYMPSQSTTYSTIWGKCVQMTLYYPLEFRGPYTYVRFDLKNFPQRTLDFPNNALLVFFHTKDILYIHDAYFYAQEVYRHFNTEINIGIREFRYQNTWIKPCVDLLERVKCRNACLDRLFEEKLKCRLPFLKTGKLRSCRDYKSTVQAYKEAMEIYDALRSSNCSCTRACHEFRYSTTFQIDRLDNTSNSTTMTIAFPDNVLEVVAENYTYSLAALLSDIGGSVGFFLGVCALSLIELAAQFATKLDQFVRKVLRSLKAQASRGR